MRENYLLALCLSLVGVSVAICWLFKRRESRLRLQLTRDRLTGVLNTDEFHRRAGVWWGRADSHAQCGTIFSIGIEQYAEISAMLKVGQNEEMLVLVAERLGRIARSIQGMVARSGTKAFIVYAPGIDRVGAGRVASRMLTELSVPYELGERSVMVVFHIGAALYPTHGRSQEELHRNLQVSMVPLKEQAGPAWSLFDFPMLARERDQQGLENDLRLALTNHAMEQFELYYQPVCDGATGEIEGYEALLRWHHPVLGDVSPAVTIELAERSGLIVPLGDWVLERACRQATRWPTSWRVHVNLSVKQMTEEGLLGRVMDVLEMTGLAPENLVLEITESIFILQYERHVKILNAVRAEGIGVALDDFGCGYSSLSHLRHLPIDWVKIDRSFISALESDSNSRAVVSALFKLCGAMNLPVVAEGVETEGQRKILRSLGCRVMQGYLLGRPAPASEIQTLGVAMS